MIPRPPRSTPKPSSGASDVYKRQDITSEAGAETIAVFDMNGSADLYYDNSKKFETNSTGTKTTGAHIMSNGGNVTGGDLGFADNSKAKFGDSNDLQIYHGTDNISYIVADGSQASPGHLVVKNSDGNVYIQADGNVYIGDEGQNETSAVFTDNGAVELYYDNFKSFTTKSNGISLYGPEGVDCNIDMSADDGDDNADQWRIVASANGNWGLYNLSLIHI